MAAVLDGGTGRGDGEGRVGQQPDNGLLGGTGRLMVREGYAAMACRTLAARAGRPPEQYRAHQLAPAMHEPGPERDAGQFRRVVQERKP
jgi:hypothetical protein